MMPDFYFRLGESFRLQNDAEDLLIVRFDGYALRQRQANPATRALLESLAGPGGCSEALLASALEAQPTADRASLVELLNRLEQSGWLSYTLQQERRPLATLLPMTRTWRSPTLLVEMPSSLRLSRFVTMRRDGDEMLLESSLGQARIRILDERLVAVLALLTRPQALPDLQTAIPGLAPGIISDFLRILVCMQAVFCCDEQGRIAEDSDPLLRQWEHHDLLFHTRSRRGRHNDPAGGNFRFLGQLPHAGAFKAASSTPRLPLPVPDTATDDPGFFAIIEKRRSLRSHAGHSLSLAQLGTLLWHVARVQSHRPPNPQNPRQYEATTRPCASAGGLHELELYLTINRCSDLAPAIYRYDAQAHALLWVTAPNTHTAALLNDARLAMGMSEPPAVLITLAARFGRVSWKYQSIAYSLILKNVGSMFQQLYLVATALDLAPCAIGTGDSERFATAIGSNYYEESSVGEFALC